MRSLIGPLVAPVVLLAVVAAAPARVRCDDGSDARKSDRLRAAASGFLAALGPEARDRATFDFDDPLRLDWHFVPRERDGLPLGSMNDDERRAAHALLRSALSPSGYGRALGVIELESVLRLVERNPGRDPGRYYFSLFGDPAGDGPWSLRVEGHHLALNFTATSDGVAPTPLFFGANPAEVRSGERAGFKLLAPHEEVARALVKSLTAEQRKRAVIAERAPADVLFGPGKAAAANAGEGLEWSALAGEQLALASELLREIGGDVATAAPPDPRASRFAWAGGFEPGEGHYWRLSGPEFVFEYDNTQDGANHVHFLWRHPANDFAATWLARHHATEHGGNGAESERRSR